MIMAKRTAQEHAEWAAKKIEIVSSFNSGGDWRTLATKLSIQVATAYRWTSQCNLPDTRGGSGSNLIVEQHKEFMVDRIEHNSRITLRK